MSHCLTASEVERYERDGFFLRERSFSAAECKRLCAAAESAVAKAVELARSGDRYTLDGNRFVDAGAVTIQFEHAPDSTSVRVIEPVNEIDARFDRLLDDPRIGEPMRGLIGCRDIALWTAKLNLKRPREGSAFRWHQDSPYWIHDCAHVDRLPNAMLLFDDASEGNGCLRIVAGSHRNGCLPGASDGTQLQGFFTHPDHFDESRQVPVTAPAGSLVFFSPHVVHGSLPNDSERPRRAIIVTYQPGGYPTLKTRALRPIATVAPCGARYGE